MSALAAVLLWAAAAGAAEPAPDAVVAELPFLDAPANEVWIDLAEEGSSRPLRLRVDTGLSQSFATAVAARHLGVSVRRSKSTSYRRDTCLGRDLQLWVDTRRSGTAAGAAGEHALLGGDFLSHYVLELDFARARVRFLDPDRFRVPERDPSERATVLPLRLLANRPIVELELGGVNVPAVIATGAAGTLVVTGRQARRVPLHDDPEATAGLELPAGAGRMAAARAERVRLGPFEELDVPLLVAHDGLDGGPESLLGVDFLKRFVLRIDYPRRRVWIAEVEP